MKKKYQNLLVLIILIINCIVLMIFDNVKVSNTTMSSDVTTKDRLERIKEKGVLTFVSSAYTPYVFIDPKTNELTGIDVEILTEVAKRLGINKIEMKQLPFKDILNELNTNDDVDMAMDGIRMLEERKKKVLFTDPWYEDEDAVIIPKFSKIIDKQDLRNAVVGVLNGAAANVLADKWKKEGLIKKLVIFESLPELISAVNNGKVDAIVAETVSAAYILPRDRNLFLKPLAPYKSEIAGYVAPAVKKSDVTLANAINEKVQEMRKDNSFYKILKKYGVETKL